MAGGNTYVPVTGDVANYGARNLPGSPGESGGGEEVSGLWLNWTAGGYTNSGWYPEETPILTWWNEYNNNLTYGDGIDGSERWITEQTITDLSSFFNSWDDYAKGQFIYTHENIYKNCTNPA